MNPRLVLITVASVSLAVNFVLAAALYEGVTTPHAVSAILHRPEPDQEMISCWGDSLTAGAGVNFGHDYPHLVGAALGRTVFNGAFGGDTSTQIKHHMISRVAGLDRGVTIIWAGRNDFETPNTVKTNIEDMIRSLPVGSRYLVLNILNGNYPGEAKGEEKYTILKRLNDDLATAYADRYVPVREYLISNANPNIEGDVGAKAKDIIPPSLRSDNIHLNNYGYALVAALVERTLILKSW
jgi:lysophospholipase L1-like esterase